MFLHENPEKLQLMQYWYSQPTIDAMVAEVEKFATKVAFLSTPSIFFSLISQDLRERSVLFEYDMAWENEPGFVKYDYKRPEDIPVELHNKFDYIVIDPPQITEDVWEKYAEACKLLLVKPQSEQSSEPSGPGRKSQVDHRPRILLSTIGEHHKYMEKLLGCQRCTFRPNIPNLIYQYSMYTNYESVHLNEYNPEIDSGPPPISSKKGGRYTGFGGTSSNDAATAEEGAGADRGALFSQLTGNDTEEEDNTWSCAVL